MSRGVRVRLLPGVPAATLRGPSHYPRRTPTDMTWTPLTALVLLCRPGFEPECAAEVAAQAGALGIAGYPQTERDSGLVRFVCTTDGERDRADTHMALQHLIFARQKLAGFADLPSLPPDDRITLMLAALRAQGERFCDLRMEHADSDAARPLAGLARSLGNALRASLRKHGIIVANAARALHVVLLSGTHVLLAATRASDASPWPQGIPRLKLAREAPSRSALKLEEALHTLLTHEERARWLKPGMKAADLGAAPGGWSWVLARAGVQVTAIDNGPLAEAALATGLIRHVRADGFRWQPAQALDWMVCDMVEQPRRVAARMADWFAQGWCRRAIFNLKLPMKKRYAEVQADLADFVARAAAAGVSVHWRAKQLYHDREEITVLAWSER